MSRWRLAVVAVLLGGPFAALALLGWYFLWLRWGVWTWWPLAASMALGYGLALYWQRRRRLLPLAEPPPPEHWTDRDREASRVIDGRLARASTLSVDQLTDVEFYRKTTIELAHELAVFYYPGAQDPLSHLTAPEVLAVAELVSHDLAEMVEHYVPGGNRLSLRDWQTAQRWAKRVTEGYQLYSNVSWAIAALLNPVATVSRYAASQAGLTAPVQLFQQDLLLWFYRQYVRQLGTYLIELNSGRLRVGATRYRQLVAARRLTAAAPEGAPPDVDVPAVPQVTITLLGQVKAGKSALVNALLGERRAQTDVLPATSGVDRYELTVQGVPTRLVLQDTVGYGHAGPKADQLAATREAARESDMLLLVTNARNPGRQADVAQLEDLDAFYRSRPDLKRSPLLVVLTHIDLLSPALEWSPPYDWRHPSRPKEQSIQDAMAEAQKQLGRQAEVVVPVCAAAAKVCGVAEELLPLIVGRLDEAHGVGMLRCLMAEANTGTVRVILRQLVELAKRLVPVALETLARPANAR
jgi:GTPase Era involved in 16S rRNA processing